MYVPLQRIRVRFAQLSLLVAAAATVPVRSAWASNDPPGGTNLPPRPSPPAPPSNLHLISLSCEIITWVWNDNSSNETGFKIYRRPHAGGAWTLVKVMPANTTAVTVYNPIAGDDTLYDWKVASYRSGALWESPSAIATKAFFCH